MRHRERFKIEAPVMSRNEPDSRPFCTVDSKKCAEKGFGIEGICKAIKVAQPNCKDAWRLMFEIGLAAPVAYP